MSDTTTEQLPYQWRVLKFQGPADPDETTTAWHEIGRCGSQYSSGPDASDLGEQFGAGTLLLVSTEERYGDLAAHEITIVATTVYERYVAPESTEQPEEAEVAEAAA